MIYQERRRQLFSQMPDQSIAIILGAKQQHRNDDVEYPFRQNSNFYYITGFTEPDAVCVLVKETAENQEFILFCKDHSAEEAVWIGHRDGVLEAKEKFGAENAWSINELPTHILNLLQNKKQIFYTLGQDPIFDQKLIQWVKEAGRESRRGQVKIKNWIDFNTMIEELRVIKSGEELNIIKEACRISALAHQRLLQNVHPLKWEYELEGEFIAECYQHNARFMAYPSIVASGENACTLHYIQNNKSLQDGELLLVDAGCEYQYYASDITRTYPVNGRFTKDQRAIYELVLKAQQAAIEIARPKTPWHQLQEVIIKVLVEGLVALNILQGDVDTLIHEKAYRKYYMHSSGHWLGLDVHDAGAYKVDGNWRPLESGMVFTIEPGLYFTPNNPELDKRWWGIGVRIEDDILITKEGCEVLTAAIPKTVQEIENFMQTVKQAKSHHKEKSVQQEKSL